MARWKGVLHNDGGPVDVEVSATDTALEIRAESGHTERWPYAETSCRTGGVPRFERNDAVLIVSDTDILDHLDHRHSQAMERMKSGGYFTFEDFQTAVKAVLVAMLGAAALVAVVLLLSR